MLIWLSDDRLPISLWAIDRLEEAKAIAREEGRGVLNDTFPDPYDCWWDSTIPVETYGYDLEDALGVSSPTKALVIYEYYAHEFDNGLREFDILAPYLDVLQAKPDIIARPIRVPGHRRLKKQWRGLPHLCAWMTTDTNNAFLDFSDNDVGTGGVEMPPWTVEDVRSLMRTWKDAKAYMDCANEFADYIDAAPLERLPLLQRVIRRDPQAEKMVTVSAPARTLIRRILA